MHVFHGEMLTDTSLLSYRFLICLIISWFTQFFLFLFAAYRFILRTHQYPLYCQAVAASYWICSCLRTFGSENMEARLLSKFVLYSFALMRLFHSHTSDTSPSSRFSKDFSAFKLVAKYPSHEEQVFHIRARLTNWSDTTSPHFPSTFSLITLHTLTL